MVDDRGQVLLIGAVAIAVVLIGTIYTLNSLQQTNSVAESNNVDLIEDAQRTEDRVEDDVFHLAESVREDNPANYEQAIRENISTYNRYMQNLTLTRDGTYANVSLNESASVGTRYSWSGVSTQISSQFSGFPYELSDDTRYIGRFTLNVSSSSGGGWQNTVVISNGSNEYRLQVREATSGGQEIRTQLPGAVTYTVNCGSVAYVEEIDVLAGEAGPGCTFPSLRTLDKDPVYTNVEIESSPPRNTAGRFDYIFVGDSTSSNIDGSNSGPYPLIPAVDYEYRADQIVYNKTILADGGNL